MLPTTDKLLNGMLKVVKKEISQLKELIILRLNLDHLSHKPATPLIIL
jgi:hypothetical protein